MCKILSLLLLIIIPIIPGPQVLAASVALQSPTARINLLELYTSEGCNSCPPADRWFSRLQDDPRLWRQVVPVAFHVDYWDYLGWSDRFAAPVYSERQRHYARSGWLRTPYTPGLILNGREWRQWFSRPELTLEQGPEVGSLSLDIDNHQVQAAFKPAQPLPADPELHLAVLGFDLATPVQAGENQGRTLNHDFVVLGYDRIPLTRRHDGYQGVAALPEAKFPTRRKALAAWISLPDDPRPLQAVGGWLPAAPDPAD